MRSPMLKVEGLVKAYGPLRAVDGASFSVDAGSVVALLGPNGAGKTTTFKCILGVTSFEGSIEVDGLSVRERGKEVRRRLGYLPQTPALSDGDTCRQALEFLAELKGADKGRVAPLLKLANLWEQRDTKVSRLSGGMRQRLALAAALLADPPVLLLDEPTASLDLESRREFHDLIARLRDEGKTVILSTHFLDRLGDLADRVIVLNQGRVVFDGTMRELTERAPTNRFVVNLNGTAPAAFNEALQAIGIGPERVTPADSHWEELLLASLPAGEEKEGEPR
ncbi:MAG: heme exporter protein CcmA [Dehalococcoidia bacterium]|nr:heme exporter protein CcmA [Dehalococcoidia bacterium]